MSDTNSPAPAHFTETLTIPDDTDPDTGRSSWLGDVPRPLSVWLAAVRSSATPRTPSHPLWLRLLDAALQGGWSRSGDYDEHAALSALRVAAVLADGVGAPAGERLHVGSSTHIGPGVVATYTTSTGTAIVLTCAYGDVPARVVVRGVDPVSVLRRTLDAAAHGGLDFVASEATWDAALAKAQEDATAKVRRDLEVKARDVSPERWTPGAAAPEANPPATIPDPMYGEVLDEALAELAELDADGGVLDGEAW